MWGHKLPRTAWSHLMADLLLPQLHSMLFIFRSSFVHQSVSRASEIVLFPPPPSGSSLQISTTHTSPPAHACTPTHGREVLTPIARGFHKTRGALALKSAFCHKPESRHCGGIVAPKLSLNYRLHKIVLSICRITGWFKTLHWEVAGVIFILHIC